MKKAILIFVVGLLLGGNAYAKCPNGNCKNGYGTYTWTWGKFAGSKYVGEFKNGKESIFRLII